MHKTFSCLLILLAMASAAQASDAVQNAGHKHFVKTSHAAGCLTPSGKASRECSQSARVQPSHVRSF